MKFRHNIVIYCRVPVVIKFSLAILSWIQWIFATKIRNVQQKVFCQTKTAKFPKNNDISCKTWIYFSTENFLWNFCVINRIPNFVGILYNQIDVGWSQNVSLAISFRIMWKQFYGVWFVQQKIFFVLKISPFSQKLRFFTEKCT